MAFTPERGLIDPLSLLWIIRNKRSSARATVISASGQARITSFAN